MNILLVGSGGREHALAWKIARSPLVDRLVCAPGNPGIAGLCEIRPIAAEAVEALAELAVEMAADLVVVGPESAIAAGLADRLADARIPCFGPSAAAGRLETSKAFAKAFAERHGLPTARHRVIERLDDATTVLNAFSPPFVIKADGLAAGKGVVIAQTREEAEAAIREMLEGRFGAAGARVIVEEYLEGEIASLFALCDGARVIQFGGAQDHKRAYDGELGPNTGGMGVYAPAPVLTDETLDRVRRELIEPALAGIAAEGAPYRGVLFCETMITNDGPRLIEFNVRFGDPECQVLMLRLEDDIVPYLLAGARGGLERLPAPSWTPDAAICVVMAAEGYPGAPVKGAVIKGADQDFGPATTVFQAGTQRREDGALVSAGGRVLNVCARAATLKQAADLAYDAIDRIDFPSGFHRTDIGWRALGRHAPAGLDQRSPSVL